MKQFKTPRRDPYHAQWKILRSTDTAITIEDTGHTTGRSVTNDAEYVVEQLAPILFGRRLLYFDSMGELDEILIQNNQFAGFHHPREAPHVENSAREETAPRDKNSAAT